MGMFKLPAFLRRYLRRSMHPMAEKTAWSMKSRLSVIYGILAWNACGLVIYQVYKGNKSWPITVGIRSPEEDMVRPAYQFAKAFGMEKAKVIRVNKFSSISDPEDLVVVKDEVPKQSRSTLNELVE